MPKRGMFDSKDDPIGLTGAFAPVKGPQSVDYDSEAGDDPVGLTGAFGVGDDEDERSWTEEEKWKDFDWDAALGEPADEEAAALAEEAAADEGVDAKVDAGGEAASAPARKSGGRGRHAAPEPELSPRMKKSRRVRRILIVLIILLVIAAGVVGFFTYRTWTGSHQEAEQQAQEQISSHESRGEIADVPARDARETAAKLADVPNLANLLGKTQDEAIAALGRGALVTSNSAVNEDDNPIKTNLNVALTEEPADSKTGTPTVYLGLGEDGKVRQAGYSASASALGFGALSFADAVNNEHVIEKTLAKVGVSVAEGSAVLPANKDEYSTYASDKTTVVRERCSFEGDADVAGMPCTWSSVLSYDYTTQVVTGNLNDTVRVIYVYITEK